MHEHYAGLRSVFASRLHGGEPHFRRMTCSPADRLSKGNCVSGAMRIGCPSTLSERPSGCGRQRCAVLWSGISTWIRKASPPSMSNMTGPCGVGTVPRNQFNGPRRGAIRIFENPGSRGLTPRTKREMMFAGAAPHAWFQVRLGLNSGQIGRAHV